MHAEKSNPKKKRFLVTAGLPYSNGNLHVGHIAGAYLPCDIFVRHMRQRGADVRSICGSDDHGVAILLTAEKEGKSAQEVACYYSEHQLAALEGLGINFDIYSSTSRNPYHAKTSQDFFLKLYEKGFLEKKETSQFYDEAKGMFLADRYVKGVCAYCGAKEQHGDQCEECGKVLDTETLKNPYSVLSGSPASVKNTSHWFLDLSRFESEVRAWLGHAQIRNNTRNYVSGLLSGGLVSRAMTRDLTWGIPIPLDDPEAKNKVLYVWFDAPIGYISNTKELCARLDGDPEAYSAWWKSDDCEVVHFIGEDNTVFHTVIWIAMLSAEGSLKLPTAVVVNNFLNIKFPNQEEEKISKSRGTAIWIEDYLASGANPDVLRYYLTAISPEQARTVYQPDDLISRNNSELGNVIGNLVTRVFALIHKNFGPVVPEYDEASFKERDKQLLSALFETQQKVTGSIQSYCFKQGLEQIMAFGRECNRYLDDKAPWKAVKIDKQDAAITLACVLNAIKGLAIMLSPYLPFSSERMLEMFNLSTKSQKWEDVSTFLKAGHSLNQAVVLFPRME